MELLLLLPPADCHWNASKGMHFPVFYFRSMLNSFGKSNNVSFHKFHLRRRYGQRIKGAVLQIQARYPLTIIKVFYKWRVKKCYDHKFWNSIEWIATSVERFVSFFNVMIFINCQSSLIFDSNSLTICRNRKVKSPQSCSRCLKKS